MSTSITADLPALTPLEAQVLAALEQGRSVSEAAREAGLHRSTIYHWLNHNPAFAGLLGRSTRQRTEALLDRILELANPAFDTIQQLVENENTPPAVRLRAAKLVLDFVQIIPPAQDEQEVATEPAAASQTPRNALCPCGSGVKYKRCCGSAAPPLLSTSRALAVKR